MRQKRVKTLFSKVPSLSHYSSITYLPRLSGCLHSIGDSDVLGPDVKVPFLCANNARENVAGMDADPHIDVDAVFSPEMMSDAFCTVEAIIAARPGLELVDIIVVKSRFFSCLLFINRIKTVQTTRK